ncbi:MAG: hypothetical protein Ct9H90mP16_09170 [Candidatus Poseidoniales archaeon]|nr:MAG: hypothetical protein Ct9H90mP16_09170 [Candidatus Poseidoniales archaeon]
MFLSVLIANTIAADGRAIGLKVRCCWDLRDYGRCILPTPVSDMIKPILVLVSVICGILMFGGLVGYTYEDQITDITVPPPIKLGSLKTH